MNTRPPSNHPFVITFGFVLVLGLAIGFSEFRQQTIRKDILEVRNESLTLKQENRELEARLSQLTSQSKDLIEVLQNEQQKSSAYQEQIGRIAGTIGMLDKLSKTDKELLQKYSKVYFLNEHYVPGSLTVISPEFSYPETKVLQIHTSVSPHLEAMLKAAATDGINLKVVSAYRSFTEQASLKSQYKTTYGTGANQFSADQGYSEHQLGTTIDWSTADLKGALVTKLDTTKEFEWMKNNAHKFGFVLSYPKGNQYYQYEPWHWRFVGIDLATKLHDEGKNFYDIDQRDIDAFLSVVFD